MKRYVCVCVSEQLRNVRQWEEERERENCSLIGQERDLNQHLFLSLSLSVDQRGGRKKKRKKTKHRREFNNSLDLAR